MPSSAPFFNRLCIVNPNFLECNFSRPLASSRITLSLDNSWKKSDPIVNDHLGDVLWMLGRKREAKFQWKKSLSFKPEPVDQKNTEDKLLYGLKLR